VPTPDQGHPGTKSPTTGSRDETVLCFRGSAGVVPSSSLAGFFRKANPADVQAVLASSSQAGAAAPVLRPNPQQTGWILAQPETSAFALSPPPPQLLKLWLLNTGNQADSSSSECVPTITHPREWDMGTPRAPSKHLCPTVGEACCCPEGAPHPPSDPRESDPSPTRCTPARRYLVQGQEGLHAEAHAADQLALSAEEPETVRTLLLVTPRRAAPHTHPFAGTSQTSLPTPGARRSPGCASLAML